MQVYQKKKMCFGCRACEKSCPVQCITMEPDEEGFLYPVVDKERCIECGICRRKCNEIPESPVYEKRTYAAYGKEDEIRIESSSGGVFSCLAIQIINRGGVVFGAAFDEELRVCHIAVDSIEQLYRLRGSKYVQSDTADTYVKTRDLLNRGVEVLYSGTPCQIAGLKKYLGRDYETLICVSIICYGVPSPLVWKRYIKYLEGDFGKKIDAVSFRKKQNNSWREYGMSYQVGERTFFYGYREELFMKSFFQNILLRPSCYNCRIKEEGIQGDIVLGDFWRIEKHHPDIDGYKGVSAVITNSVRGEKLFSQVKDLLFVKDSSYDSVLEGNQMLEKSVTCPNARDKFWEEFGATGRIMESLQDNVKNIPMRKEERFAYMYPILLKYTQNIAEGKLITRLLAEHGINRVVLYAVTEFTDLLIKEYERNKLINVVGIADQNYKKFYGRYGDCSMISLDELVQMNERKRIDGIIVCSPLHANVIIDSLTNKGIEESQIFTITQLLY